MECYRSYDRLVVHVFLTVDDARELLAAVESAAARREIGDDLLAKRVEGDGLSVQFCFDQGG